MLGTLFFMVGAAGCLVPPDIAYEAPPAPQPPRIEGSKGLSPDPSAGPIYLSKIGPSGERCGPQPILATVVDPDSTRVYWRIFFDYYHDDAQEPDTGDAEAEPGTEIAVNFNVDPNDARFGSESVPHQVELLVADQPFYDDQREPRGRAVPDGDLTDSMIWTVVLTQGAQCGSR